MKRIIIYLLSAATFISCQTAINSEDIASVERTLQEADSMASTTHYCTDTTALHTALQVFDAENRLADKSKTQYYLANAYRTLGNDSLAFAYFSDAADGFLQASDSVYYPLTILELSMMAEEQYHEDGNATMLQAIRTLQRELMLGKQQSHKMIGLWIILAVIIAILILALIWFLMHRKEVTTSAVSRADLERNIELVLSQGNVRTTLCWHDYEQFCKTSNAYFYNLTDKLLLAAPQLTEQDIRFLVLVTLDLSAKEIADVMNLSQNSISNKKTRTAQKLGTTAASLRETLITITLNSSQQ